MSAAPGPASPRRQPESPAGILTAPGLAPAVVAAAALLTFLPSLWNGFVWDDLVMVVWNPLLQRAGNLPALLLHGDAYGSGVPVPYYRPLTTLTFALDTLLWGDHPLGFHATSLLLHVGTAVLLLLAARRLLAPRAALAAALLFAVHPALAEPVSYIAARADLLSGFLLLAAFLGFSSHLSRGGPWRLALAAAAFGGALAAKIVAGLFPVVLALHPALRARGARRRAWALLPFGAVALGFLALRAAVLGQGIWRPETPLAGRLAAAGPTLAHYFAAALAPVNLRVYYPWLPPSSWGDPLVLASWLAVLGLLALAVAGARRDPRPLLGLSWFLAALLPVSGVIAPLRPAALADRYLYVALIGAALAVGALIERLLASRVAAARPRLAAGMLLTILLALAVSAGFRQRHWRDSVALWEEAAHGAPRSQYVLDALGWAYKNADRPTEARAVLERSLEIREADPRAHLNLAGLAFLRGDLPAAERHTRRTLEIDPGDATALRYFATVLEARGDVRGATAAAERSLGRNPFDRGTAALLADLRHRAPRRVPGRRPAAAAGAHGSGEAEAGSGTIPSGSRRP